MQHMGLTQGCFGIVLSPMSRTPFAESLHEAGVVPAITEALELPPEDLPFGSVSVNEGFTVIAETYRQLRDDLTIVLAEKDIDDVDTGNTFRRIAAEAINDTIDVAWAPRTAYETWILPPTAGIEYARYGDATEQKLVANVQRLGSTSCATIYTDTARHPLFYEFTTPMDSPIAVNLQPVLFRGVRIPPMTLSQLVHRPRSVATKGVAVLSAEHMLDGAIPVRPSRYTLPSDTASFAQDYHTSGYEVTLAERSFNLNKLYEAITQYTG